MTGMKRCTKCGERKARGTPRGPTFPELHDPAWLKQRYMEEMLTPQEIADRIGCSAAAVNSAIRRAGIPRLPLAFRKVMRKKLQEVSA